MVIPINGKDYEPGSLLRHVIDHRRVTILCPDPDEPKAILCRFLDSAGDYMEKIFWPRELEEIPEEPDK